MPVVGGVNTVLSNSHRCDKTFNLLGNIKTAHESTNKMGTVSVRTDKDKTN